MVNTGDLWLNEYLATLDPATTPEVRFIGVLGEVFYLSAEEQDCEYVIQVEAHQGKWRDVASGVIPAGDTEIVQITFLLPKARVVITPKVAQVHVDVSAYGYPAVYAR